MIPVPEALKIIESRVGRLSGETIKLADAVGRVLTQDIFADTDLPPFDRSQMDGFAVREKDVRSAPAKLEIIGESAAGKGFDGRIKCGETIRIMTGARVPKGADAVQKKELAQVSKDGKFAEILESVKPGQNIVSKAEEIKSGVQVFSAGEIVNPQMIAVLASFGYSKVKVFRQPKVSVLATGSEIVSIDRTPAQDQIRDSNSASLKAFAEQAGASMEILPRTKDDLESLKRQIAAAVGLESKVQSPKSKVKETKSQLANRKSQILILSGGVSVGDYDFTKPALRELGAEIYFEKVALRPGKPTVFARLNDCFVFGLPGNPVSVAVTFFLFVRKAILQMQGAKDCDLREGFAVLTKSIKGAKERDSYIPGKISFGENARLSVEPVKWGGSSDFVSFSKADCLIYIPRDERFEADRIVKIAFLP